MHLATISLFELEKEIATNTTRNPSSDNPTKLKNREITRNWIRKPHLGKLPGSGNFDEFQLLLDSFLQADQSFWTFRTLNILLLMKSCLFVFFSVLVVMYIASDFIL